MVTSGCLSASSSCAPDEAEVALVFSPRFLSPAFLSTKSFFTRDAMVAAIKSRKRTDYSAKSKPDCHNGVLEVRAYGQHSQMGRAISHVALGRPRHEPQGEGTVRTQLDAIDPPIVCVKTTLRGPNPRQTPEVRPGDAGQTPKAERRRSPRPGAVGTGLTGRRRSNSRRRPGRRRRRRGARRRRSRSRSRRLR